MSGIPSEVAKVRKDLSEWLWHFTNAAPNPLDTVLKILDDKRIKASMDSRCSNRAVCFTEMPLINAINQLAVLDRFSYKRLSGYGIGFPKSWIFAQGGLPVIYQPRAMRSELRRSRQWRHCDFDLNKNIDFTWQREWRVPHDVKFKEGDELIVVVKTNEESGNFYDGCYDHDRDEVFVDVLWPSITHEAILASKDPFNLEVLLPQY